MVSIRVFLIIVFRVGGQDEPTFHAHAVGHNGATSGGSKKMLFFFGGTVVGTIALRLHN